MTKKQKQMVVRMMVVFVMLAAIMAGEHTGLSERIQPHILLAFICLIPYLIIGYDILYKAARNIRNGQVFDENFLMMIATFGAFGVGALLSGGRAVSGLCGRKIPPVDFGYDGHLPGICKY